MSASDPRFVDGDRPVQRLSRRAALKLALGGAGLAILAACAPQPPAAPAKPTEAPKPAAPAATTAPAAPAAAPKPTEAPKPAAAAPTAAAAPPAAAKPTEAAKPAAATPKSGGTLKVGQAGDIVSLDPHFNQYATSDLAWTTYDRLIQYDTSFKPTPMLAESWEVSSDNKQIKFNLRKGVQWHSGREMTSEDVKYTLNRVLDPKVGVGQYAAQAKWWVSVETPDKYTVIAKSDEPRPLMFDFWELLNISDKEILEGPDAKSKINGTGPFKLKEWVQGDHATFEKNKNYWQSGKPYLDAIELKIMADSQAMMVQLESGAIDVVRNPTKQEFARLQKDSRFTGVIYPNTVSGYAFGINVTTPPLTDKRVRQALNYAFDRKRYVESMLAGVGKPVSLPWAQSFPMYEASKENHYTFDLDKAKAMLAEANVSNLEMEFLISPAYPEGGDVGAMFQADLAKIGVKLTIVKQETAAWSDMVNNRKYPHLYYAGSNLNLTPGTIFSVSRPIGPKNNNEGFETPEYTKLVETVAAETDPAKLKALYSQLNDTLLNEAFFNFLSPNYLITLTKANVKDFTPAMHGRWLYTDIWLS